MLAPPRDDTLARLRMARWIALLLPLGLLGGALLSEVVGGLIPCEMCWWQRYPHAAAILIAGAAMASPLSAPRTRALTLLAALTIAVSGAIGVYHAGVEYRLWEGFTTCTANGPKSLQDIIATPLIRCDQVQWSLFGISLAGFNAIFSLAGAGLIALLATRGRAR